MKLSDLKASFDRDGYVAVRKFLPDGELNELISQIDRYIREVAPGLTDEQAYYQDKSRPATLKQLPRMDGDPFFAEYSHHAVWTELAASLLGESCTVDDPQWFNKPPGTQHPTPAHQDNFYLCLQPPSVLTMWLALDVVDEENGCLRYLPGSHKYGPRPHGVTKTVGFSQGITDFGPPDRANEVTLVAEPGDLICHHGEMVHRADANRSATRSRRAFAMVAKGASCRRDEGAYRRYLASSVAQRQAAGLETGPIVPDIG